MAAAKGISPWASRAALLPGIEEAAIAANHPLDSGFTNSFVVGREAEAGDWPEISAAW